MERPTIVLQSKDEAGSQKIVLDFSPELERLQPGMGLQEALSLYGEVDLVQADIPYYRSVFDRILDRLERNSPLVEGSELGCVYIGLDGMQLLYRDDEAFIKATRRVIPEVFKAQLGIADGKFLAYLMARYDKYICPTKHGEMTDRAQNIETFLKDLPCDILPISIKSKSKLRDYGIKTLGQLSNIAEGPIQAQFGLEGKRMLELSRGYDSTPLYPRSLEETIEESITLSSVTVSLESMLASMESLISKIFDKNILKGKGIRSLVLWTRGWNGEQWERTLEFKEPAMDIKHIVSRIKLVMENYPQPGPVEQVGIRITRLGYAEGRQKSLFSEVRAKDHLMEDIKQLNLRLGKHQVFKVKEVEPWSRIPERRYALISLD